MVIIYIEKNTNIVYLELESRQDDTDDNIAAALSDFIPRLLDDFHHFLHISNRWRRMQILLLSEYRVRRSKCMRIPVYQVMIDASSIRSLSQTIVVFRQLVQVVQHLAVANFHDPPDHGLNVKAHHRFTLRSYLNASQNCL